MPSSSLLRQRLIIGWLIGLATAGALLLVPVAVPVILRRLDPQGEREELAQAAERRQRAGGERIVTTSGEVRRAVVYTPALMTQTDATMHRWLTWATRIFASLILIRLLVETVRLLRERGEVAR